MFVALLSARMHEKQLIINYEIRQPAVNDDRISCVAYLRTYSTNQQGKLISSSAMTERPRKLGDFKGVGHFEAKF